MNKLKMLGFAALPVLGLSFLGGAGIASAHGLGFGSNATPDEIATRQQTMFTHESELLGISVDEVKSAWAAGKNMEQLMTEKGITQAQVQARMKEERKTQAMAVLKALVDKGVITQAQADQRLQTIQKQIDSGKDRGMGMKPGMGKGRGFHKGQAQSTR